MALLVFSAFSGPASLKAIMNAECAGAIAFLVSLCLAGDRTEQPLLRRGAGAVALPALAVLPFLLVVRTPFLADSCSQVLTASRQSFADVLRTAYVRPTGGDFFFRPLGYFSPLSLAGKWAVLSPLRWHLDDLALHLVATYLVFFLGRHLGLSQ